MSILLDTLDRAHFRVSGQAQNSLTTNHPLLIIEYQTTKIGEAHHLLNGATCSLSFTVLKEYEDQKLLWSSLIACSLIELQVHDVKSSINSVEICTISPAIGTELLKIFGFTESDIGTWRLELDNRTLQQVRKIKLELTSKLPHFTKFGRGYIFDATAFDAKDLDLLNDEYNKIAWGPTQWATHGVAAQDEILFVKNEIKGGRVLEVGSGSGRLIPLFESLADEFWASDYLEPITQSLKLSLPKNSKTRVVCDDITDSKLKSEEFDTVALLENGLGALLDVNQRLKAIQGMTARLKTNGKLLLGVRSATPLKGDQLMIASIYPKVMGIYHTFLPEEVLSLTEGLPLTLERQVWGEERPAGGRQCFFVFKKENR